MFRCLIPCLAQASCISFISPAIVSPELVDVEIPKDDGRMRRGLMVIAKVIQNLANNIFFGKEAHMIVLNEYLQGNILSVTRYLSDVNVSLLNFFFLLVISSCLIRSRRRIPQPWMILTNGWAIVSMIRTRLCCTVSFI